MADRILAFKWRRMSDDRLVEIRRISRLRSRQRNSPHQYLRVRVAGRKTWQTWHEEPFMAEHYPAHDSLEKSDATD